MKAQVPVLGSLGACAMITAMQRHLPLHVMKRQSSPFLYSRIEYSQLSPFAENQRVLQTSLENITASTTTSYTPLEGDLLCPCIDISKAYVINASELPAEAYTQLVYQNVSSYGYDCTSHDLETLDCVTAREANQTLPPWCPKKWCWIDPSNCELRYRDSVWVRGKAYSYATCRNADAYLQYALASQINGLTLKVGVNSNSGGWRGAFHQEPLLFDGTLNGWYGPTVEFVKYAAKEANITLKITEIPDKVQNRSAPFFNDASPWAACIYAAALGIVDFCISQYTITALRASVVDWMILDQEEMWLITQIQDVIQVTDWFTLVTKMGKSFDIIKQPFETGTWIFLIFFVVPVLGIMFIIHEYGQPGSSYPVGETEEEEGEDGTTNVTYREIPIWEHLSTGLYNSFLSVLQGGYEDTVVSTGGFVHLIGVAFFLLTIIAVYTANLAAILTDRAKQGDVDTIIKALRNDYRFCADRKTMKVVINYFPTLLHEGLFVVDPDDGLPGYQYKRFLTLDNMDVDLAIKNESYCHAAIGFQQDLEAEQGKGRHCNKTTVGKSLGYLSTGIPLSAKYKPNLHALFSKMINLNVLAIEVVRVKPDAKCDDVKSQIRGETKSLSIQQLAGIWAVTFGFASMGLLIHYFKPWRRISVLSKKERKMRKEGKRLGYNSKIQRLIHKLSSRTPLDIGNPETPHPFRKGSTCSNEDVQEITLPVLPHRDSPLSRDRADKNSQVFDVQDDLYLQETEMPAIHHKTCRYDRNSFDNDFGWTQEKDNKDRKRHKFV